MFSKHDKEILDFFSDEGILGISSNWTGDILLDPKHTLADNLYLQIQQWSLYEVL
jgi:hypothetical protein